MKVLLLSYRGNPFCGGQGIYIYNLAHELTKLGVEVDVIVGPPYPEPMDAFANVHKTESLNIWSIKTKDIPKSKLKRIFSPLNFIDFITTRIHIFPEMETFSFRAFFLLRKLLKKKKYDIIHDVNTLGWGLLPMKGYGIPIVSTIHHPLTRDRAADMTMDKSFWEKVTTVFFYPLNMQRIVINRIDKVITSSVEGIHELNRAFGLAKNKLTCVYNGMDIEAFQNTGVRREPRTILFVGNTEDHKKGLVYLIEALSLLPEDITLTIVDEGPPKKLTAAKHIKKYNVGNRVTFTGKVPLEQLVNLYSSKSILVMSSLYEGFGLPAAEAMACKTAVVVTDAGSLSEVVDKNTGIIVKPQSAIALKEGIMKLFNDDSLRKKMGVLGRKRCEDNFSWPAAAKNTLKVYEEIVAEKGKK